MNSRWFLGLELEGVPEYRNVAAELYKAAAEQAKAGKAQAEPQPQEKSAKGGKDEGVIDAEVVEEKK